MKNWFSKLLAETTEEGRSVLRIVITMMGGMIPALPLVLYLALQSGAWQLYVVLATLIGWVILLIFSAVHARQNRTNLAMALIIGGVCVLLPGLSALIAGLGPILSITEVLAILVIVGQTLSGSRATRALTVGILSAVLTLLIDLFAAWERVSHPLLQNSAPFIAVAVVLVLGAYVIRRFREYSLRTKLIMVVAFILILIAAVQFQISSVNGSKQAEEQAKERLIGHYQAYLGRISAESNAAGAMATMIADRPDVQELYLKGDFDGLYTLLLPMFEDMKERQIVHLYIENPDGTVFLRVHNPEKFGDDVTYRGTAADALALRETTSGVEMGPNRMGVRGVAPMYSGDRFIGMVEVGLDFDDRFIAELKQLTQADFTMWVSYDAAAVPGLKPVDGAPIAPIEELFYYASTSPQVLPVDPELYRSTLATGKPSLQAVTENTSAPSLVYILPLLGYKDKSFGLLEISLPYLETLDALRASRITSLSVVGGLTLIGLFLILIATSQFVLKPIQSLTQFANLQMSGDTSVRVHLSSGDEFEQLANTFNSLADSVEVERKTLEQRVAERTQSLELASEVGRSVSQVRALDVMLADAAELIRSRFDLYYVQVYLTDASQKNLLLLSGTGKVGEQLLGRGHRLPLNTGSINGRAATEKKSVVISDTSTSATFRPNPLLPDTRSEMAVPLVVGEKVVGVLNLQSDKAHALDQEALPAFEALAGQMAIAIQNAKLLAETEQARAEVEAQARRLVRANWADYQDAIYKPEEIGFVFEQNKISAMMQEEAVKENSLVAPISVTGEALGNLVVETEGQLPIKRVDELLDAVARQVSQQIENLRLLDSAERYRLEAEEASRRLTREGWKSFASKADEGLNYVYDLKQVRPRNGADQQAEMDGYTLPIKVRDEKIGKLIIQGLETGDNESVDLASAVAERLGVHIESLRQYDQAQSALTQSEKLFEASSSLTRATNLQELVAASITTLGIAEVNRALLVTFDYDAKGELTHLDVIANWWSGMGQEVTAIGTRYPLEIIRAMPMFVSSTPVFFDDTLTDERVDATTLDLVKGLNLRAVAVLPLHVGSHQMGALILEAEAPHHFTQEETRLFTALAPQIATVVENRRQFEQAQKQAERESRLNVISQKIQSATTVEAVLQIAARELGHTLGAPLTIAQLGLKENSNGN